MRILMITEKDAANHSLTYIADAFLKNNHLVEIFAPFLSDNSLRMFNPSIRVHPVEELSKQVADQFDCIFASAFVCHTLKRMNLLDIDRFIFTYDFLIHGDLVNRMDFGFSPSIYTNMSPYRTKLNCPLLGIGEPRFDQVAKSNQSQSPDNNQILFIDSGHYPFGSDGRRELSKTLLGMARAYPECRFVVKPRFLPDDAVFTHRNKQHLYDSLATEAEGSLPTNLVLLMKYRNLEELINESRTIVCMYTTAYITALVAGKGLIILDGLPNQDNCDLRVKRLAQTRTGMVSSGALVDYRQALQYLPDGIPPNLEHLHREVSCLDDVSGKIVATVQDVVCNHLTKSEYPQAGAYTYPEKIEYSKAMTWEDIKRRRLENCVKYFILTRFDYYINAKVDLGDIDSFVSDAVSSLERQFMPAKQLDQRINALQNGIITKNADTMLHNPVDASILLQAYYEQGMHERILSFPSRYLGSYKYYAGILHSTKGDFETARSLLEQYIINSEVRDFKFEVTDNQLFHMNAYSVLAHICGLTGDQENAAIYAGRADALKRRGEIASSTQGGKNRAHCYVHCLRLLKTALEKGEQELLERKLGEGKIILYGAGSMADELLSNLDFLRQKIAFIADRSCFGECKHSIPIILADDITKHPEVSTVLITVPHLHDEITQSLRKRRSDLCCIRLDSWLSV